jgi:biopolymer transport protein ExbB
VFEIIVAGGWVMIPIILSSVVALAIIVERFWTLRQSRIAPAGLAVKVLQMHKSRQIDEARLKELHDDSPLGRILATGLVNMHHPREVMKERVEDAGRYVIHELERYLNTLGTIAAVAPLLGLLGSVTGLMEVFTAVTLHGAGNPQAMAEGISEIMIATAAGLAVAIPTVIFYRYFQRRVDDLAITMEQEALTLIDAVYSSTAAVRS